MTTGPMTPGDGTDRNRMGVALVCALALFGLYVPSSVGGTILDSLAIISLAVIAIAIVVLLARSPAIASASAVTCALALIGVLAFATVFAPFGTISRGVLMLYLILAAICCLRLPRATGSPWPGRVFLAVSVISLAAGALTALNVKWIDLVQDTWFAAFRPTLVSSMVDVANKPVLTFATHSMAAFMFYLLFFMALRTWQASGRLGWFVIMAGHAALLVALNSTTAWLLLIVAVVQTLNAARRGHKTVLMPLIVAVGIVALGVWLSWHGGGSRAVWHARLLGDANHGFIARYAAGGLLADDVSYLRSWDFRPIGVTYTSNLYLADSGIIVALLRGSLPLLVATYAALFSFFRSNLVSRRTAWWLCAVTAAFDFGFTPLQYFRFLAFLPFVVMYLASMEQPGAGQPLPAIERRTLFETLRRNWWLPAISIVVGGAAAALWQAAQPPQFRAVTRFETRQSPVLEESRRAHVVTMAYLIRQDPDFLSSVRRELPAEVAATITDDRFRFIDVSVAGIYWGDMLEVSATLPSAEWAARTANRIADALAERSAAITSAPGRVPILERVDRALPPQRPQDFMTRAGTYGALAGGCLGMLLVLAVRRGSQPAQAAPRVL